MEAKGLVFTKQEIKSLYVTLDPGNSVIYHIVVTGAVTYVHMMGDSSPEAWITIQELTGRLPKPWLVKCETITPLFQLCATNDFPADILEVSKEINVTILEVSNPWTIRAAVMAAEQFFHHFDQKGEPVINQNQP